MVPFDFLPKDLSETQQFFVNVALFLGVVLGVVINFLRNKSAKPPPPEIMKNDVVLQSASIADMRPVREAAKSLSDLVEIHRAQAQHMDHLVSVWRDISKELTSIREIASDMAKETEISNRTREGGAPRRR